ncbi:MAG: response regulator [Elusimicrobiota bacterium]
MSYRVLIIDDSALVRALLQEMLQALGHQVVGQAGNAADGLQSWRSEHPDLVLLDISLPDQDGFLVLEEMRGEEPSLPVLFVTGNTQKKVIERARELKASGVLKKPFDAARLAAAIEAVGAGRWLS